MTTWAREEAGKAAWHASTLVAGMRGLHMPVIAVMTKDRFKTLASAWRQFDEMLLVD